jgi:hypothetical protein
MANTILQNPAVVITSSTMPSLIATTVTTSGSTPASDIPTGDSNTHPWGKFQYVPALGGVVIQPMWKAATVFLRTH